MNLRCLFYFYGKFHAGTMNQTVVRKEFVELVSRKWKLFRTTLNECYFVSCKLTTWLPLGFSDYLSFGNCNPDLLCWWCYQTMNRFNLLTLNKMEFETSNKNRQENQPFSDGESPSWTLTLACKTKWLVGKVWKLFDVLWAETIRIKPGTAMFNMSKEARLQLRCDL